MTKPAPLLLTEPEAAGMLKLCQRTLREARQEGKLRYILIGRAVRYTIDDLESFIASLREVNQCPPASINKPKSARRQKRGGNVVPFRLRRAGE